MGELVSQNAQFRPVYLSGWGRSVHGHASMAVATSAADVAVALTVAGAYGKSVAFVGGRKSYGDAFLNEDNVVIDLSRLDRILSWDPVSGIMRCQPGVTLSAALACGLADHWVIPHVPGTQWLTVGGAVSNNVHGKNAFRVGNFGACVRRLQVLLVDGSLVSCSRSENLELFQGVIGGAGLLGAIVEIELALQRVPSAFVLVRQETVTSMGAMLERLARLTETEDYVIGQTDCFAPRASLGRGTIHVARFIDGPSLAHAAPGAADSSIKRALIGAGRLGLCDASMRMISISKYLKDRHAPGRKEQRQSFFDFNFLLDKLPGWEAAFRDGLIEQEPLIPRAQAEAVFRSVIEKMHAAAVPPYLAGIKLHTSDDFLLSYGLDGFSIGLSFPAKRRLGAEIRRLCDWMNAFVADHGGQMYLAKDQTMRSDVFRRMYPSLDRFLALKRRYDPGDRLQSNLYRRLMGRASPIQDQPAQ